MNLLFALSLLLPAQSEPAPSPAPAQAAAPRPGARPVSDPNHIICRRDRESGSRLVIRRICMTRQEWADFRRELRQNVDRAQTSRVHPVQ